MQASPISVLERGLAAVGDLLAAEGVEVGIIVGGGTALNLLGIVQRTTDDVDVLAVLQDRAGSGGVTLAPPDPLPEPLQRAIARVARDFQLPKTG
jgi:hypothetical protein